MKASQNFPADTPIGSGSVLISPVSWQDGLVTANTYFLKSMPSTSFFLNKSRNTGGGILESSFRKDKEEK